MGLSLQKLGFHVHALQGRSGKMGLQELALFAQCMLMLHCAG